MFHHINVKPLSVNRAWKGRRFKTVDYKEFEKEVHYLLPKITKGIPSGRLQVHYQFGVSNKSQDYDNSIKQFQDILSRKYNFNDNRIYRGIIDKIIVPKGEEFIKFEITKLPRGKNYAE